MIEFMRKKKLPFMTLFYNRWNIDDKRRSYPLTECRLVGKWQMVNEGGTLHNECAFYDVIGVGS